MDNTTPTVVIAELEATPLTSKDAATSTESKDDVKVMVVGSTEHEGLKLLSGTDKSGANMQILEEVRQAKLKNPAVLVNLPSSPSAQAYEVTQQAKPDDGYFQPAFTEEEAAAAEAASNKNS
ncbi:hypothetical protein L873DRAFT_1811772 [Choiromyces venosus 120613-1]|uniref:Uncharacterized protein n=1 Tax=Choiromyces venosus 120613-1 TaxID=1336337 RepID=A0A3N4JD37_9PEZI|nr:hypothetical protein L873DRAFT_1811772 [Choiromyces venosus 120613-1]